MTESLNRQRISTAVSNLGWRYVLGTVCASLRTGSPARGVEIAARLVEAAGEDAESVRLDVRGDRLVVTLQAPGTAEVTAREVELAHRIAATCADLGLRLDPGVNPGVEVAGERSVQMIEIAVDALDIARVRPFWKAVLGYVDEPGVSGPQAALVDAVGQGPAVWFQQMDEPRPQRNRIHLDISVPHDEADHRIRAALEAGGTLLSDTSAPAFWVLADSEGNEACVTTWQGRD